MTALWVASAASFVIAAVYVVVVPRRHDLPATRGWRRAWLRWGHSAAWIALGMSFALRASEVSGSLPDAVAILGGVGYVGYVALLLRLPRAAR